MHPSLCSQNLERRSELFRDTLDERGSPFTVQDAHPPNVSREMSLSHKVVENCLVKVSGAQIHCLANRGKPLHEVRGNHKVAYTHGWKQNLAERSDVNHPRVAIESLERSDGHVFVAVFTVVVIFNDPGAAVLRPLQQLEAPRRAHGCSQRILVRGRYV